MTTDLPTLNESPDVLLFHIAEAEDWAAAGDDYAAGSLATEGFIHLSAGHQVLATTDRHYASRIALLLLEITVAALDADSLRWEPAPHGEEYPHLYGPIPVTAVAAAHPWPA